MSYDRIRSKEFGHIDDRLTGEKYEIIIDKETGVNYLLIRDDSGRMALSVMYGADGRPLTQRNY